ncbi:hypothetical protein C0J08_13710 [Marinomonas sp. CT5]|uniref:hypothetical protein n=1 Tax=Marinomonas sp. CT5 TaxID=2066133 RepID=UPI001BAFA8D5|nr:hypothetical protein [Marinomonas sp. CT5]QUX96387.1 hypothetical protein C0J08_13710 [Marinomonas sp. CT5]
MKKQPTYLCLSILLGITNQTAFATPINAVIGLDNSQVVENSSELSLTPNTGTLLPLQESFAPITHLQNNHDTNWFDQINHKVRVEHKLRDLNYTGTLTKIEQDSRSFVLSSKDYSTKLPMDDFYLIPLETPNMENKIPATDTNSENTPPTYKVSYQTNQLSWTPQLSLIIDDDKVSISQQALIHNNSSSIVQIQDSLLHYSRTTAPRLFKTERSSLAMSADRPDVNYQDNEISYTLGGTLSISPYSNTLIPLPSSDTKIEKHIHQAKLYTYGGNSGKIELNFYNNLRFTLQKNGIPGEYKTFWKRGELLIPGNTVHLNTIRKGNSIDVITNKSQDITGYLSLVSASSQKLPSTQVWKATIINHSNTPQAFSVEQNTNGIVEVLEGKDSAQIQANSLIISGNIKANSKKTITYKIDVKS